MILLRRAERKRERQQGKKIDVIDDKTEEVRSRRKLAFLDLLLEVHEQDPSFTLEDIREEVDTFMFEVRCQEMKLWPVNVIDRAISWII